MAHPGRRQHLHLPTRCHHRLVRGVEFAKIAYQPVGHGKGFRLVEHEVAQEGVEVAQVFGRLRLVQQAQRHLAVDAEQAAEAFAVGAELVLRIGIGQCLLELADIEVVAAEVAQLAQVERPFQDQEVALDVGIAIGVAAQPEQLDQHHVLAHGITVVQGQRRPGGALAQVAGGVFARVTVALRGPCTAHVADQVAVAAGTVGFARGSVEIDPARRDQQGGKGVEQGGLAGAPAPHDQKAAFADRYLVQFAESAPVIHLQPCHAELLARGQQRRTHRGVHAPSPLAASSSALPSGCLPRSPAAIRWYNWVRVAISSAENSSFNVGEIS